MQFFFPLFSFLDNKNIPPVILPQFIKKGSSSMQKASDSCVVVLCYIYLNFLHLFTQGLGKVFDLLFHTLNHQIHILSLFLQIFHILVILSLQFLLEIKHMTMKSLSFACNLICRMNKITHIYSNKSQKSWTKNARDDCDMVFSAIKQIKAINHRIETWNLILMQCWHTYKYTFWYTHSQMSTLTILHKSLVF